MKNSHWSLGAWAKALKVSGAPALSMIMNGQHHPGHRISSKLVDYFKFNGRERAYFLGLVHLGKTKNQPEVAFMLKKRLQKMNPKQNIQFIDEQKHSLLSSWLPFAVREMSKLDNFESSPTWIAKNLRFSATKAAIKRALCDLRALKMLELDDTGRLRSTDFDLDTHPDIENHASRPPQISISEGMPHPGFKYPAILDLHPFINWKFSEKMQYFVKATIITLRFEGWRIEIDKL